MNDTDLVDAMSGTGDRKTNPAREPWHLPPRKGRCNTSKHCDSD